MDNPPPTVDPIRPVFDAPLPPEMATRAEASGVAKASMPWLPTCMLGVLGGAFIALGADFSLVATVGGSSLPFGVQRVLAGVTFSLGLILVVVGGAELFTGNNLIVMAWANRRVSTAAVLRNWLLVYAGNFVGAVATAALMVLTQQYATAQGAFGRQLVLIAGAKCSLEPLQAFALGIACNVLVCLAVWLCAGARSTTDKILSILFPISAFVAAGFEHCVANMFLVPYALFARGFVDFGGPVPSAVSSLAWSQFLVGNLLPVTLGNIVGGSVMVGFVYWSIYLRPTSRHVER